MSGKKIGVLIVDDSRTIRSIVRAILSRDPQIEVVGEAQDPYEAREEIKRLNPDVLTLDVEMPRMDGLEFLGHLMRLRPMPVVMVSSLTQKGSAAAVRALSLGAVECVDRTEVQKDVNGGTFLCDAVRLAASARVRGGSKSGPAPAPTQGFRWNGKYLLIGSSTGGVDALEQVLTRFPANCPPTLICQHMPPSFLASFAQRMNGLVAPECALAQEGERLAPGRILLAPGGTTHLAVAGTATPFVRLTPDDGTHLHVPSVDVLFNSARNRAADVVCALLTGMGRDGAAGMLTLRQGGATTFAQSGQTCVVDGMPRVARELGAVGPVRRPQQDGRRPAGRMRRVRTGEGMNRLGTGDARSDHPRRPGRVRHRRRAGRRRRRRSSARAWRFACGTRWRRWGA